MVNGHINIISSYDGLLIVNNSVGLWGLHHFTTELMVNSGEPLIHKTYFNEVDDGYYVVVTNSG